MLEGEHLLRRTGRGGSFWKEASIGIKALNNETLLDWEPLLERGTLSYWKRVLNQMVTGTYTFQSDLVKHEIRPAVDPRVMRLSCLNFMIE